MKLDVDSVDLRSRPIADREAVARQIAATEAAKPFDLSVAPLLRAVLITLDDEDHVLLLTMHHIVSDAWSATIFMQELRDLYTPYSSGTVPSLPQLTLQYADYAAWQREWLSGDTLNKQLAFWRERLSGAPPLLTLPTDHPRPERQSFEGAISRFQLSPELTIALKAICRKEGVTLFMVLLAGYQILLSRLSGQEQVVVGTDSANRFSVETERMIGFFINLLALKTNFEGNPTFRDVLAQVRETTLACYAHQEMPFDKIVEELRPDRNLSHNPIVQVLFVMQNAPVASKDFCGLRLSGFGASIDKSKFDIAVFAAERGNTVEGAWVYSTELFESETIERMARMFSTLLSQAVAEPTTRVSALELYSEQDKQAREQIKEDRKQSSKKKLTTTEPKAISLGHGAGE